MSILLGGIEAGGTKFICAVGTPNGTIQEKILIPTTTPDETMPQVLSFFQSIHEKTPLSAIGIGSFGPIDLHLKSKTYGYITSTSKLAWRNFNILGAVKNAFSIPIAFDLDVNASALGEQKWGAAQECETFLYVTIGTGIGAGGIVKGNLMHGLTHPEMGHIFIPQDRENDPFEGVCPYHKNCFEGLASGPSIMKRWKVKSASALPEDHKGWELEALYIAHGLSNLIMTLSPKKIILGGGVMKHQHLFPMIRTKVQTLLNGYIQHDNILNKIESYIVPPGLKTESGILGAIALANKERLLTSEHYSPSNINEVGKVYTRPWGTYQTLIIEPHYQVKQIIVKPDGCLSLQKHAKRHEHWTIVQGSPLVTIGNKEKIVSPNETIHIPAETLHRMKNPTENPVVFIEVQYGSYLGEDDIVRVDDIYNRTET